MGWWCGALVFWCGRLVLVDGLVLSVFLIPGLLVWVGGVGHWRGISSLRRGDHHPCEVLHSIQCSFSREVDRRKE